MTDEDDKGTEKAISAEKDFGEDKPDSENVAPEHGKDDSPAQEGMADLWGRFYKIANQKRVWVSLLVLALVLTGILAFKGSLWNRTNDTKAFSLLKDKLIQDDLRQEALSRFYIPLPQESDDRVIVIDLSVIWNSISAVRFRKMEVQMRERLYEFMVKLAEREHDLESRVSFIETEIGGILRESLHTEDLAVKIKEIKSF